MLLVVRPGAPRASLNWGSPVAQRSKSSSYLCSLLPLPKVLQKQHESVASKDCQRPMRKWWRLKITCQKKKSTKFFGGQPSNPWKMLAGHQSLICCSERSFWCRYSSKAPTEFELFSVNATPSASFEVKVVVVSGVVAAVREGNMFLHRTPQQ